MQFRFRLIEQARANSKKTQDDASANVFTIMFEKSKFLQERKNNNYNTEKPTLTLVNVMSKILKISGKDVSSNSKPI